MTTKFNARHGLSVGSPANDIIDSAGNISAASLNISGSITATTFVGSFSGSVTGTASTATSAATAYSTIGTLTAGTGLSGTTFNGSADQTWTLNTSTLMTTAVNLNSGLAGSVPYQSGASTTTFLGIGAANTLLNSSGTAPVWTTALTGLTIDNSVIGGTTPAAGTFTTLIGGGGSANYGQLTGGATTKAVEFKSLGSDTNVSMAFCMQGTGAIDLAPGSGGVNISNGGTVTAITRTATGSAYTSIPSVAITAPTTAGGVQATASANMFVFAVTVASGGTGYTVGDVLTIVGGTGNAAQATVATVSGGVITGLTNGPNNGLYSVLPSTPATTTGGTGSGATINLTSFGVSTFTITNAGSGYVEQPTVSFSGGGGSGATAYATVGSDPIIKTLSSDLRFFNDIGEALRLSSNAGTTTTPTYLQIFNNSNATLSLFAKGSNSTVATYFVTKSTASHSFATNDTTANVQFRVSHTASPVNYVQVTGAATTAGPTISTQGSDASVQMNITTKAAGNINLAPRGSTALLVRPSTVPVNYFIVDAANTNVAPVLSVAGSDTNIDLTLTPKGTGSIRFGAADAAAPVAQTLAVQSVVAGTSNTAGTNFTIKGSQGTGTGAGGSIIFQTAPAGSSGTSQNALVTALVIDSSGNLGLGVTPSAWVNYKAVQISGGNSLAGYQSSIVQLGQNYYYDGAERYYATGVAAAKYLLWSGSHIWYNTPSGTANTLMAWTQAMTLDTSGNLGIGTSSPGSKLDVNGTANFAGNATFSGITSVTNSTSVSSTNSGALQVVNGGVGIGGGLVVGNITTVTNTTAVSSTQTGALQVRGGIAVAGSGYFGGTFTATNIVCSTNMTLSNQNSGTVLYTDNGRGVASSTLLKYDGSCLRLQDISGFNTTGYVRLAGGDGPANGAYVQLYGPDHATYPGRLYLNASIAGGYIDFGIASVVKMKLDSSGNLGIGTTSPNSFLHIKGGNNNVCNIDNDGSQYTNISISNNGTEKGSVYWDNTNGQFTLGSNATNSQVLFRANNAERARIDSSGNLGLGVTPSAWGSPFKPIQIGNSFSFIAGRSDAITAQVHVGANAYYNGTNWLYGITGLNATRYYQNGGQHIWENAPSGTAGNAITFTQAMTLDASGNLGIGTTSPAARLELTAAQPYIVQSWNQARANGSDYVAGGTDSYFITRDGVQNLGAYVRILDVNTFGAFPTTVRGGVVAFGTVDGINGTGSSAVERARITSGGDVLYNKILYSTNGTSAGGLALYRDHATGSCYLFDTTTAPYSGPLIFGTNNTERARIDGSGKLGIGTTSPAQMLDVRYAGSGSGAAIRFGSASYGMGQLEEESSINAVIFKNTYSTSGIFLWKADTAERARINSSGNLYVGTTSSSVDGRIVSDGADLYYSGNFTQPSSGSYCVAVHNRGTTGDNSFITFFTEAGGTQRGTITYNRGGGLTAYNTTSDYRAKKIIGPVTNPGATIDALKVYTGKMHGATVERPMLIAHEAQAVTPYAVTGEKDDVNEDGTPKFQQIDVSSLVPLLIAEIQSLRTRVAQLEKGE